MRQLCDLLRFSCTKRFPRARRSVALQVRTFKSAHASFQHDGPYKEATMAYAMMTKNGRPFDRASLEYLMRRRL